MAACLKQTDRVPGGLWNLTLYHTFPMQPSRKTGLKMFEEKLQIGKSVDWFVHTLTDNFDSVFDVLSDGIEAIGDGFEDILLYPDPLLLILLFSLIALWRVGWGFGLFSALALTVVAKMQLWDPMMSTLALVLSSTALSLLVGIPLGIWTARSEIAGKIIRPFLDFMQTMPAFVYLIPAAMFFGVGKVPGIIATVVFAMPPAVRLTDLGIRRVPREMIEAGLAFGCTSRQLLFKVQIPNAMPSIMAGVNQNIMLALSMVVIASMVGAGGLGNKVLTGIQRMDVGAGFEGGVSIVILAIILDRVTQSFSKNNSESFFSPIFRLFRKKETEKN